mgnify:FL=1|tara:strand:- start:194 stop:523 length:330 start_codon:yes stop_codon:yes gene_type:complete
MGKRTKQSSGDAELAQIYKKIENEIRAAEALVSGLKPTGRKKPSDYQAAMKEVRDKDLTSKNAPGGVFKKGGSVKKKKKFPDLSGDGKITKKDILIAKGVIKKKPKKKR